MSILEKLKSQTGQLCDLLFELTDSRCFSKLTFLLKEHGKPVHIKKRLNNCSICDHGYSQKKGCQLSFSGIDILERHANHYHEDRTSHNNPNLSL